MSKESVAGSGVCGISAGGGGDFGVSCSMIG